MTLVYVTTYFHVGHPRGWMARGQRRQRNPSRSAWLLFPLVAVPPGWDGFNGSGPCAQNRLDWHTLSLLHCGRLQRASTLSSTGSRDYHRREILARTCRHGDAATSAGAANFLEGHRHGVCHVYQ